MDEVSSVDWSSFPCNTLWYAWSDWGRCGVLALNKDFLAPVAEEAGYPLQDISTNSQNWLCSLIDSYRLDTLPLCLLAGCALIAQRQRRGRSKMMQSH